MSDARPAIILHAVEHGADAVGLRSIGEVLGIVAPTALARAAGLWACKRAWQQQYPESRRGGDRRSAQSRERNQTPNFGLWLRDACGVSLADSTIKDDVALADRLGVEAITFLWDTKVADHAVQLKIISHLPPPARDRLWAQMRADKAATFDTWMQRAGLRPEQDSDEQAFQRFAALWAPASKRLKRRILDHIGVPPALADQIIARPRDAHRANGSNKTAA